MKKISLLLISITLFSFMPCLASANNFPPAIFAKNESHNTDSISSIGIEIPFGDPHSHFGAYMTSAIGYADITDKTGNSNDYLTWDTGFKFGYFSDISIYGEVGLDLFELIWDDLNDKDEDERTYYYDNEEYDYFDTERQDDDIDGYIGVGIGFNLKPIKIDVFTRLRQIDGNNWESKEHLYSGLQLSIVF